MQETVTFVSGGNCLEGRFSPVRADSAVAITHPHPLMGGDMDNGIVVRIADTFHQAGWAALRFNFRGTGGSQGRFDDGIGEQEDVQSAVGFLSDRGYTRILLAGYSFGAWIIARWAQRNPSHGHRILLVSPPVDFLEFQPALINGLHCVIAGQQDSFGRPDHILRLLPSWNPEAVLDVIPDADHFFSYQSARLSDALHAVTNHLKL